MENDIRNFDSSYSPLERFESTPDIPECVECGDSGMVQVGDRGEDFCVCEIGHEMADDFHAQEPNLDDYADADALASCGMGTDEDYGCYDSGDYF